MLLHHFTLLLVCCFYAVFIHLKVTLSDDKGYNLSFLTDQVHQEAKLQTS